MPLGPPPLGKNVVFSAVLVLTGTGGYRRKAFRESLVSTNYYPCDARKPTLFENVG